MALSNRRSSQLYLKSCSMDSPEPTTAKTQSHSASINRSQTVYDRRTSSTPSGSLHTPRGRLSPLKRFREAKENISRAFGLIREELVKVQKFLGDARGEAGTSKVSDLLDKTQGIEDMLSRDHMKVAFFGRTSNGKSSVVNALLGDRVLPSGIGHTTNCFCSVMGADSSSGFLITPGSEEEQDIKVLQQLAHSLHREHLSPSSLIRVFWPKRKCSLLQEDVEFVDSPGVDMDPNIDDWITKHCLDADVFVLVSNAESTLMTAEKNFFHCVSSRLSKPNIFILNNRWDASAHEPELMEEVRQQHIKTDIEFLVRELKVADEKTARERVYFISAKEVLAKRMNSKITLADGHGARLLEFEQFESKLKKCLSSSAIRTKFEQHHQRGTEVVIKLEELLKTEEKDIADRSAAVQDNIHSTWERSDHLSQHAYRMQHVSKKKLEDTVNQAKQLVQVVMADVSKQLTNVVDQYNAPFDEQALSVFKQGLYSHVDRFLSEELNRLASSSLSDLHQSVYQEVIASYQQLLEIPLNELTEPSHNLPQLNYQLQTAEMCSDFHEDMQFHFTLGLSSLMGYVNSASLLSNAQQQINSLTSLIPSDLVFPLSLLVGGALLSRFLSWRYLIPSVGFYCLFYVYERFTWNNRSKEAAFKRQLVTHVRGQLDQEVRAIRTSYSSILSSDFDRLMKHLTSSLESCMSNEERKYKELTAEKQHLSKLSGEVVQLRKSVHFLQTDLEGFKETYLDDDD